MMMVVAWAVIGGRAIVVELIVHVMVVGVMIGVMLRGIQRDVREHHVFVVMLADDGVLQVSDNAGGGSLGEHEQQGDAQHRPSLPQQGTSAGPHG
jgi:hypothetical protein